MELLKEKLTQAYDEHGDAIFRYCYFKISDREQALDLVQETYVKTWQYLLDGNEVDNMKVFLYTVARNLIIDTYRKKKSYSLERLKEDGIEPMIDEQDAIENAIDAKYVIEYVKKLPEKYASVLLLRYVDDLSIKEIAKITKESENVVSVRIYRGLGKLKIAIKAREASEEMKVKQTIGKRETLAL